MPFVILQWILIYSGKETLLLEQFHRERELQAYDAGRNWWNYQLLE